ncbi:MAG: hypothetical protein JNM69_40385 [Archangium sp.]|nr:hypothetical protein [Archangium sp.]
MLELKSTITRAQWLQLRDLIRANPARQWRFVGDDGFERTGYITHFPAAWAVTSTIHVGPSLATPGEPLLVGLIRRIDAV